MTDVVMDLRAMCRSVSPLLLNEGLTALPPRLRVEPLPGRRGRVAREMLPLRGYVDGVQSTRLLTVRDGDRPVYLAAVAAGLMDPSAGVVRYARWRVALLCSYLDREWAEALPDMPCEIELLDGHFRDDIDLRAQAWVDQARRGAEEQTVHEAVAEGPDAWTVLDGSLAGLSSLGSLGDIPQVVGLAKTCERQYLTDEHLSVHDLLEGELSRPFLLPAQQRGQLDRASCYLRQRDRGHRPWTFGLVRLEVPAAHAALLPEAGATVMAGRQAPGRGDSRWDRHQAGIARLESALHASLPYPLGS